MKQLLIVCALFLGVGAFADVSSIDENTVVTPEQMESLYNGLDTNGLTRPWGNWYCEARSYWSGLWYYWIGPNPNYARYMALNACVRQNGYTCQVACRPY